MRLYIGDVVETGSGRGVIRDITREPGQSRACVQIGTDWTWLPTDGLSWSGECLAKLPKSERGWRKLGKVISGL